MKGRYVTWFRKVGDLPHVTNLKAKLETRVELAVDVRHHRFPPFSRRPSTHAMLPTTCGQRYL